MSKRKRLFNPEDIIFSYTAKDAERDEVLFNIKEILRDSGIFPTIRITGGIKEFLLSGDLKETDEFYRQRVVNISVLAVRKLKSTKDRRFASFDVIVLDRKKTVWACVDTTSGPAIHLMFPDEY